MTPSQIKVRNAVIGDAASLSAARQELIFPNGTLNKKNDVSILTIVRRIELSRKKGLFLVAEVDKKIVGHASLEPMHLDLSAHIYSATVIVHKDFSRRSVGSILMNALLIWAQETPYVEKIELVLSECNRAAFRFFSRYGFTIEGRFENRIKFGDRSYSAEISMALLIR